MTPRSAKICINLSISQFSSLVITRPGFFLALAMMDGASTKVLDRRSWISWHLQMPVSMMTVSMAFPNFYSTFSPIQPTHIRYLAHSAQYFLLTICLWSDTPPPTRRYGGAPMEPNFGTSTSGYYPSTDIRLSTGCWL